MLDYIYTQKKQLRHKVCHWFRLYGLFAASHPLPMILFSGFVIVFCSAPLFSLPVFERLIGFLFQRIRVDYNTEVKIWRSSQMPLPNAYAYVQQINFNASLPLADLELHSDGITGVLLDHEIVRQLSQYLRAADTEWQDVCLKLTREPPSMKSLKQRILYSRSRIHHDLKEKQLYHWRCMHMSPTYLKSEKRDGSFIDASLTFQELTFGYPVRKEFPGNSEHRYVAFTVTLFIEKFDASFIKTLKRILNATESGGKDSDATYQIIYKFSHNTGPVELVPLSVAYVVVFLYLWFSVAKLDLIRTRWGLAFSAVMSFIASLTMTLGICAFLDILPTTLNVSEIFPYFVIIIGLENFWIITKAVMQTRKILEVKDRIAEGLELEGWYITKNLVIEMCLLIVGYCSGVKAIQEFCMLALAGYLTDFFLQLTFYVPILAVDTRRAKLSECVTIRQSFEYGFFNLPPQIDEVYSGHHSSAPEAGPMPLSIKLVYVVARFRILQRSVMVLIVIYFYHMIYESLQNAEIMSGNPMPAPTDSMSPQPWPSSRGGYRLKCWTEQEAYSMDHVASWQFLCLKHWPELFSYYFIHLNSTSLVVLPQIDVPLKFSKQKLLSAISTPARLGFLHRHFNPWHATWENLLVTILFVLAAFFLVVKFFRGYLKDHGINLTAMQNANYEFRLLVLESPIDRNYLVTSMAYSEEDDRLACVFMNGNIFVWDLYDDRCTLMVDRKKLEVRDLLQNPFVQDPAPDSNASLPPAVWAMDFRFQILVAACAKGQIEVYSLEADLNMKNRGSPQQRLLCVARQGHGLGYTHIKIITGSKFVAAREDGRIDTYLVGFRKGAGTVAACECYLRCGIDPFSVPDYIKSLDVCMEKIYVVNIPGQMKILRVSDDGRFRVSDVNLLEQISAVATELAPDRVIMGTATGSVHIMDSSGVIQETLYSTASEIESIATDHLYIAALTNGLITVWSKDGYSEHCRLEPLKQERVFEIRFLPQHTLVAVSKTTVVLIDVPTHSVVNIIGYCSPPGVDTQCSAIVVRQSVLLCKGSSVAHLKFGNMKDRHK